MIDTLKDMKRYYATEREDGRDMIAEKLKESCNDQTEDELANNILRKSGILSFPHTFLEDSFNALVRTIRALYKCRKTSVIALGVQHSKTKAEEADEFSLDNFTCLTEMYAQVNGLQPISIEKKFHRSYGHDYESPHYIAKLHEEGEKLRSMADCKTAVVMTGDLAHYGHGYGTTEPLEKGYEKWIKRLIYDSFDMVYLKKDYLKFIKKSKQLRNDQIAAAIIASSFLGDSLNYKVLSLSFSDYSGLLETEKPTVVASVFYGVWPCQNKI